MKQHFVLTHVTAGKSPSELTVLRFATRDAYLQWFRGSARLLEPAALRRKTPPRDGRLSLHFRADPRLIEKVADFLPDGVYVTPAATLLGADRKTQSWMLVRGLSRRESVLLKKISHVLHGRLRPRFKSTRYSSFTSNFLTFPTGVSIMLSWAPHIGPLGWWHQACGIDQPDPMLARGAGIRVGVVDTGIADHTTLGHVVRVGAAVNGVVKLDSREAKDVDTIDWHGTTVCGVIGSRPQQSGDFEGIAPGADLAVMRCYANGSSKANYDDIAKAIESLSTDGAVDLINLSIGGYRETPSQTLALETAVAKAWDRGVVCIAGSGNTPNETMMYPAAVADVISVGCLGALSLLNGNPYSGVPDRLSAAVPPEYFVVPDSNGDPNLTCASPGLFVTAAVGDSTGNSSTFRTDSGTSLASACATGVLADALSRDPQFQTRPRDHTRAARIYQTFLGLLQPLQIPRLYGGNGRPVAP